MKLEDQVCSLELAKRLKELGVKQESCFWWIKYIANEEWALQGYIDTHALQNISAFTVAELLGILPSTIDPHKDDKDGGGTYYWLSLGKMSGKCEGKYMACYGESGRTYDATEFESSNPADALAALLIYLIESNLAPKSIKGE